MGKEISNKGKGRREGNKIKGKKITKSWKTTTFPDIEEQKESEKKKG